MRESPINWPRKHCASCMVHKDARGATDRSPETSKLHTKASTVLGAAGPPSRPTASQKEQQLLRRLPGRRNSGFLWSCYSTPQWDRSTQHLAKSQGNLQHLPRLPQILPGEWFQLTSLSFTNTVLPPATPTDPTLELFADCMRFKSPTSLSPVLNYYF